MPLHVELYGNLVFDGDGQERGSIHLEVGTYGRNGPRYTHLGALSRALQLHGTVVGGLAAELDLEGGADGWRGDCGFGKLGAYNNHGELRSASCLQHVKVAIGVAGVERFDRYSDEELTFAGAAIAFAPGIVTDAIHLMHRSEERRVGKECR